jgi:hypothetical protein
MPADILAILSALEPKIAGLAKSTITDYAGQATEDAKNLLAVMKDDLARWTQQLEDGKITVADFRTLVIGDKDLAEMTALTQAGLALARIDQFRVGVLNLLADTVFAALKI